MASPAAAPAIAAAKKQSSAFETLAPISAACAVTAVAMYPVDVVRALKMASATGKGSAHGIRGLLSQGVVPEVLRATGMRIMKFFFFPLTHEAMWGVPTSKGTPIQKGIAGGVAVVPEVLSITTLELAKIGLQLDSTGKYGNSINKLVSDVYKTRGLAGTMSGWQAVQLRQTLWTGTYFATLDGFKTLSDNVASLVVEGKTPAKTALVDFSAGFLAGVAGAAINTPADVIRTNIQKEALTGSKDSSLRLALSLGKMVELGQGIYAQKGLGGLYAGFGFKIMADETQPLVLTRFFYAVDIAKRDESHFAFKRPEEDLKPQRWKAFSTTDSERLEKTWLMMEEHPIDDEGSLRVEVGEGRLFEVDISKMEVVPIYWKGPVFEVRRGTWFFASSEGFSTCDPIFTRQVEEGYEKTRGWVTATEQELDDLGDQELSSGCRISGRNHYPAKLYSADETPFEDSHVHFLNDMVTRIWSKRVDLKSKYAGQYVVYPGDAEAWAGPTDSPTRSGGEKERSVGEETKSAGDESKDTTGSLESNETPDVDEIPNTDNKSSTVVDHSALLLVVHGIGAKLAERFEGSTFLGHVDRLRKNIRDCIRTRSQAHEGGGADTPNRKVIVLPVQWRQHIEERNFIDERLGNEASENNPCDFSSSSDSDDSSTNSSPKSRPTISSNTIQDISLPTIPNIKAVGTALAVDVLVYMTPLFRRVILEGLAGELNRIVQEWKKRHPHWTGSVSVVGHSLGSCLLWDVLISQNELTQLIHKDRSGRSKTHIELDASEATLDAALGARTSDKDSTNPVLHFEIDNFF
ncbi:hypothetical protein HDU93_000436, partial [Gonapodya sp. JEL0774]